MLYPNRTDCRHLANHMQVLVKCLRLCIKKVIAVKDNAAEGEICLISLSLALEIQPTATLLSHLFFGLPSAQF